MNQVLYRFLGNFVTATETEQSKIKHFYVKLATSSQGLQINWKLIDKLSVISDINELIINNTSRHICQCLAYFLGIETIKLTVVEAQLGHPLAYVDPEIDTLPDDKITASMVDIRCQKHSFGCMLVLFVDKGIYLDLDVTPVK